MSVRHTPQESCLPPPPGSRPSAARSSPVASLALFGGDRLVVWITDRWLGFGGFADEPAAARAAWAAHAALARWVARGHRVAPPLPAATRLEVSTDDGERWVLADGLPIARLVDPRAVRIEDAVDVMLDAAVAHAPWPPGHRVVAPGMRPARPHTARDLGIDRGAAAGPDTGREDGAHVGFEIAVPLPVGDLQVRSAAYAVYRALCRAGLPWRLWNAGSHARRVDRCTSS